MAESKAFIYQAMSKVFRLAPVVRLVKKAPSPITLRSFITGFDDRELRIGTPLQHMPTERIFEVTTRGWEAAQ
ncbi:MAG: hypothetical protein WBB85_04825, partial [Albidovulum sp.]|uniref:hypothetical protein n=1 Tax=Albidovulum sp. TaxID=1872424 RepID=UPI003C834FF2